MGCETYKTENVSIRISESDLDISCLCTFPHNDTDATGEIKLTPDRVKALAYLGAAIVLAKRGNCDQELYIPNSIPENIRKEIDKYFSIYNF